MNNLVNNKCTACNPNSEPVASEKYKSFLTELPEWEISVKKSINTLCKLYSFKNYAEALQFTNEVANLAEAEGHHPKIILEWGKVEVNWWTHKIKNLHINDFIMAAKTEELFNKLRAN